MEFSKNGSAKQLGRNIDLKESSAQNPCGIGVKTDKFRHMLIKKSQPFRSTELFAKGSLKEMIC